MCADGSTTVCFYALGIGRGFATPQTTELRGVLNRFYALGIGRGFATARVFYTVVHPPTRFYALGIGRGFATGAMSK